MRASRGGMRSAAEYYADSRTKGEAPSQRIDQQTQIAGVADDRYRRRWSPGVTRLDGDQSAEPVAEHEDRPQPQRATGSEQNDAEPANGIAVDGPELPPVGVGRQVGRPAVRSPRRRRSPSGCRDPRARRGSDCRRRTEPRRTTRRRIRSRARSAPGGRRTRRTRPSRGWPGRRRPRWLRR